MASAGFDLTNQVANAFEDFTTTPGPLLLSAEAFPVGGYPPWWCTPSVFKTNSTCGTTVPPIALSKQDLYDATGQYIVNTTFPTNYNISINNAMQTILAAIRIDLGNIFPNNFLVHRTPDVIGGTISSTIPIQGFPTQTSMLYGLIGNGDGWLQNHGGLFTLNPDSVSPSQISLEYQCRHWLGHCYIAADMVGATASPSREKGVCRQWYARDQASGSGGQDSGPPAPDG
ncbi:hypothetical protein FRB95_013719 [Tulasnella sp. JGI-2019a]|nr:hypothetical protein FRB95_013719 [Tulasnella sp. JGI-2019a]